MTEEMSKWKAEKDAFSNGLIDTGSTVFHVMDIDSEEELVTITTAHNADCDTYEARIAELESALSSEVADNARLRARDVGDCAANLLQEIADKNNRIAELERERDQYKPFHAAVMDMAVVNWTYRHSDEKDYDQAIKKLIHTYILHANDPAISQAARERDELKTRIAAMLDMQYSTRKDDTRRE